MLRVLGPARVVARNSVTGTATFNAFVSDLDLALLFRDEPRAADVRRVQAFLRGVRAVLPFVGEAEIYTEREWALRQSAQRRAEPVIQLFWNIRKLRWIENDRRRAASRYHRRKAELGLRRCFDALGETGAVLRNTDHWRQLATGFHRFLDDLWHLLQLPPVPEADADVLLCVQCDYLGLVVTSDPTACDMLAVPGKTLIPFLALLPPSQRWVGRTEEVVERYRAHPEVAALRESVARWEWCVAQSCARTHPTDGHGEWVRRLVQLFREHTERQARRTFAERLPETSPTLCLAAWKQSTVNLHRGMTHSCCLAPAHPIDAEAVHDRPSALHNTERKKRVREALLAGGRPTDCNYCWELERTAKQPQSSDRFFKSNEPWALTAFDEVVRGGAEADTPPSYLEVSFSHRCNLKCSYCNASVSSRWQQEVEQHGPYRLGGGLPYMDLDYMRRTGHRIEPDGAPNPFVDAFWKWWPELVGRLRVFRITGGEPLLHADVFRVLRYLREHPQPELEFAINSNLSVPPSLVRGFLQQAAELVETGSVRSFTVYTSVDTHGAHAEYLRHGLRYDLFRENLGRVLDAHARLGAVIMCTFNALSVPRFERLLDDVIELRRASAPAAGERLLLDVNRLRAPTWQALETLDDAWKARLRPLVEGMRRRSRQAPGLERIGFTEHEILKVERLADLLESEAADEAKLERERADFYRFFREHDRRRGTSFEATFPEMKAFWARCARAAEQEDGAPASSSFRSSESQGNFLPFEEPVAP
jgi:hypothetical protein